MFRDILDLRKKYIVFQPRLSEPQSGHRPEDFPFRRTYLFSKKVDGNSPERIPRLILSDLCMSSGWLCRLYAFLELPFWQPIVRTIQIDVDYSFPASRCTAIPTAEYSKYF
jgi:hypothetical protein